MMLHTQGVSAIADRALAFAGGMKAATESRCGRGERHQAAQRPSVFGTQQFTGPSHWTEGL
jgi:hypothetical protein